MFAKLMRRIFLHIHILILTFPLISGSTWDIPPGTVFIGPNITARSQASFLPNIKDRDSTYVDFNTKLRTGLLTQFQYYIDTQGASGVSPVYVRFQVWEVLGTFFVAGVPSNYTVALRYEQRHLVDIATGVYTVSKTIQLKSFCRIQFGKWEAWNFAQFCGFFEKDFSDEILVVRCVSH